MAKAKKTERKRVNYRLLYLASVETHKEALAAKDGEITKLQGDLRRHAEWTARLRGAMNDNQREAARMSLASTGREWWTDPTTREEIEEDYAFEAALILFERQALATGGFKL